MITYRPATPADHQTLLTLARETFAETYTDLTPEDLDHHFNTTLTPEYIESALVQDHVIFALDHETPIGYIQFGPTDPNLSKHIHRIYLRKTHQRQGIGTHLLNLALNHPIIINAPEVSIDVWSENTVALRLYQSHGFKITREYFLTFPSGPSETPDYFMTRKNPAQPSPNPESSL
jgi:diamine N-acetyltransferase